MKVVLVHPPISREEEFGNLQNVGNIIPPLGIAYIGALLEREKIPVRLVDCAPYLTTHEELSKILVEEKPDIIGYSATTLLYVNTIQAAKNARKVCPKALIVTGGAHVTAVPEETMQEDFFDVGIIGEGEYTFMEIANKVKNNDRDFSGVKGIIYRSNGKVITNEARPFIKNLDELPLPARHLLPPLKDYSPSPVSVRKLPWAHMITSRGCPYPCAFCDTKVFGQKFRKFSAEYVVEEIENVIKVHGAKEIRFLDDIFPLDRKRFFKIAEEMRKRKLKFPWTCQARVDNVDKELLQGLKDAGCWQILYGLESGDEAHLQKILRKTVTLEQSRKAVELAKEVGLSVRADFLVGFPGDTHESFKKTVEFAKSLKLDVAHFNGFTPLPGTELAMTAKKEGKIKHFDYNMYRIHSSPDTKMAFVPEGWTEDELKEEIVKAHKSFYLRFSFLLRQILQIRSFLDIRRYLRAFKVIISMN
ncbi:B12-binding domain-containing radical SAM protein [bacterium]|nr:B12-binding domain-containing radical SAM protein [bacterium]